MEQKVYEHGCPFYRPIYRDRIIEREDRYGNIWDYQDKVLYAEFCKKKADFVLSVRDCEQCDGSTDSQTNMRCLPKAG